MSIQVERVREDLYACVAEGDEMLQGWGANQGFILTGAGVIVIDTGFTKATAEGLKQEIEDRTSQPIRFVINTHDHSDHVFGNSVFVEMDVPLFSHVVCAQKVERHGEKRITRYRGMSEELHDALEGLEIAPPSMVYYHDFSVRLGEKRLEILHPEMGAHTEGDTMVYLPEEKTIFAGDVVWSSYHPNMEDANLDGWMETLREVETFDLEKVVPGHGPISGAEAITDLSKYLREFQTQLREMAENGLTKEEVAKKLSFTGTEDWKLESIVDRNVDLIYD